MAKGKPQMPPRPRKNDRDADDRRGRRPMMNDNDADHMPMRPMKGGKGMKPGRKS